jgi:hypothetical protein
MRTLLITLLVSPLLLAATPSQAAPPAPHLTVGTDIKQLIFDWDGVSGATHYRLLQKVGSGSFRTLIDNIPASNTQATLSVAVHLHSWSLLRYAVAACDSSGCTNSNTVFPQNLKADAIGYFKASNTETIPRYFGDGFGYFLVLSDDGRTLAVSALSEDSNATGVNGNQANNSSAWSGAVYVFRRVTGGWRQQAYIKAPVNQPDQAFGMNWASQNPPLAFNADGSLLAVGATRQNVSEHVAAGSVYIYRRSPWLQRWTLVATLTSPAPQVMANFGATLDMSLDGRTLKVDEVGPFSETPPRTHVFVLRDATWQHAATLQPGVPGRQCPITRLSRDGDTLVSACNSAATAGAQLETRKRVGDTWMQVAEQPLPYDLSHSGLVLDEQGGAMGLQEVDDQGNYTVGLYQWTGADWVRERQFTPLGPDGFVGNYAYGSVLSLNRAGNLLAIANPGEGGIGAINLWRRDDLARTWSLRGVINAPNPGSMDIFGSALSFCGTGQALAIGAGQEDRNARGINGDRTNNASTDAGAAYLY